MGGGGLGLDKQGFPRRFVGAGLVLDAAVLGKVQREVSLLFYNYFHRSVILFV